MKKYLPLLLLVASCAHSHVVPPPQPKPLWNSPSEKMAACVLLQDHIVGLMAEKLLLDQGQYMGPVEFNLFKKAWLEEFARSGASDRFDRTCMDTLDESKYQCAIQAPTLFGIKSCFHPKQ